MNSHVMPLKAPLYCNTFLPLYQRNVPAPISVHPPASGKAISMLPYVFCSTVKLQGGLSKVVVKMLQAVTTCLH